MKNYDIKALKSTPLAKLSNDELIVAIWEESGIKVLQAIENQNITPMKASEFIKLCTACGGDWGGMLLTGLKDLYPQVWEAIPEDMGELAWAGITTVLTLLKIEE